MNRQIVIDAGIGETRAAVLENGRAAELHIERWSEKDKRAVTGEVYRGRVRAVDGALNAAFVDLGRGEEGFLPFGKTGRPAGLHQGAAWPVRVTREAAGGKGPALATEPGIAEGDAPQRVFSPGPLAERLAARFPDAAAVKAKDSDFDIDEAFEAALAPAAPVPGGGVMHIEPTRALTAIDVDSAGREGRGGAEKLALDLNLSAAKEAARQIRLRGIGGVVAVDFIHMRSKPARTQVEQAFRAALKRDPARIDAAPMSPFGIVELARQRTGRSLAETLLDADGRISVETAALAAIRALQAAARAESARRLALSVTPEVFDWLDADPVGWRKALAGRIGARFDIAVGPGYARECAEVKTL
ncbi:MAG: ribonuclease E/G [Maricaulaceae bacterium]|nr:ribonuclease E/G [Maricaulaceae bacterium]